jgi:23S rRNA (adenine2503-C2)-methyltransferase
MTEMPADALPLIADPEAPRGVLDVPADELRAWLEERGAKPLRARQVRRWLLAGGAESFDSMSDVPKALREQLAESFAPLVSRVVRHLQADDGTHKLLLKLADGNLIECVLIQEANRRTACISTQVGCGMGCVFCASGLKGVERNLTVGEILEQLVRLRNLPLWEGSTRGPSDGPVERLTHVVVMGMGEPLANLDNLLEALDVATSKDGLGIGARHITISTVGLPVKIRRLADLGKQYHLAVSLHAANDPLRTRIIPTNDKTGLDAILEAADYFFAKTGRQVTFEYVLLGGTNDDVSHARELARLLQGGRAQGRQAQGRQAQGRQAQGRQAHVNLIPFNDVPGLPYRRPTPEALTAFQAVLRQHGVSVKVRKRKGAQIDAACGQLRRSVVSQ